MAGLHGALGKEGEKQANSSSCFCRHGALGRGSCEGFFGDELEFVVLFGGK